MEEKWKEKCVGHIGKTQQVVDFLSPHAANLLNATFDVTADLKVGDVLPPLFHWIYFNPLVATKNLKIDGHEKLGEFLPPVPYPRRMWAGSDIQFQAPLVLGENTDRFSKIINVTFKTGASGSLCFVEVEHTYSQKGISCLVDVHTIVYREISNAESDKTTQPVEQIKCDGWQRLSSIELFRYSALTFNSHRIHYDHDYVREVEGYPGLVAHGPLMATLLMRHALEENPGKEPVNFSFRGHAPVFENDPFKINTIRNSAGVSLQLEKVGGVKAISADLVWYKS